MDSIYEFFDYQAFLKAFYEDQKQKKVYFSFRYWGDKIELDPGFLAKVCNGKSHLAVKSIKKVAEFCGLAGKEAEYFELLVRYSRSESPSDISLYFEKIMAIRGMDASIVQEHQYEFYKKWYHAAIHALLLIYPFKGDYQELAQSLNPPISAREAKESIRLLEKIGLIVKKQDDTFRPVNTILSTGEKWHAAAIRKFQQETLALAIESIDRVPKEERDISTITVACSKKDIEHIREKAAEFRKAVIQLDTPNEPADTVYQINIQVLPLAHVKANPQ
jgi:uncharacterized protein (TIGR02147 family)